MMDDEDMIVGYGQTADLDLPMPSWSDLPPLGGEMCSADRSGTLRAGDVSITIRLFKWRCLL